MKTWVDRIRSLFVGLETNVGLQLGLLLLITLLAAVLRLYKLGVWSFWFDEISTIARAQSHYTTLDGLVRHTPPAEKWLPLSVILTAFAINGMGVTEWSSRLVPALIGIISVPAVYVPIKREFGTPVGVISVLLLAVAPWHIEWSQNARFYTALMLWYILASFAFFYAIEQDRPALLCLFLILLYLATSERVIALMLVPAVLIYVLLVKILPFDKPPGLRGRNLAIILLAGLGIMAYEIYGLVSTGNTILLEAYSVFSPDRGPAPARLLSAILSNIGIPLACLALFGSIDLLLKKSRSGLFFLLGAIVPIGVLLVANSFLYTDERYAFITLPSWIILGAAAVRELFSEARNQSKALVAGVLVLLLATSAYGDLLYYLENHGNRLDWRGAFQLIQEKSVDGDLVVSYWPDLGTYYLGRAVLPLTDLRPESIGEGGHRTWFAIDNFADWSVAKTSLWVERNCELMMFDQMFVNRTESLRVYLCDPQRIAISP